MNKKIIHILIIIIFPALLHGQEVLTGLYTNAALKNTAKTLKTNKSSDTLRLPFVDDFSSVDIYPNDTLWADKYTFINSSYPYTPPTVGVATFDALNDTGALYTEASAYGFTADSLTSNPIRLDAYNTSGTWTPLQIKDSVYFSFYYQPQGNGNAPEEEDSLVLEFYAPIDSAWYHVWSSEGSTLNQFHTKYNVWFKQVMIPITDSATYFHKGFRFRFYNYASLANNSMPSWAGNVDQWNIDYVYLEKDRSMADSLFFDIAFIESAPSMLKNYYAMPWSQYKVDSTAEMKDTLNMIIANLENDLVNSSYIYTITETGNTWNTFCSAGSFNIQPLSIQNYHTTPAVCFYFPPNNNDSAEFIVTHICDGAINGDVRKQNDTVIFDQKFYNYYAYDDGTPEAGYGLTPANAMLAYQFTLNHPDTLRAINMFFNQTLNDANQQLFYLTVWDSDAGHPNNAIYHKPDYKPQFTDSLNKYYSYPIDDTTLVLSGTFYVGWEQTTDDNLNLGFDKNTDVHDKIFYNTGSGWSNTIFQGALMIRPVLGSKIPDYASISEINSAENKLIVYPNPTHNDEINIQLPDILKGETSACVVNVWDMFGRLVCALPYNEQLQIPDVSAGIYILGVTSSASGKEYFTRLSVVK
jgi:hypothetical protein